MRKTIKILEVWSQDLKHNYTKNRNRIDKSVEDKIIVIRSDHFWGKDKIEAYLRDHYNVKENHNTVMNIYIFMK